MSRLAQVSSPLRSVAVITAVEHHGRFLVQRRRDNGLWEPPGGVLERDETPLVAVEREALEETGVTVRALELRGVMVNLAHDLRPVSLVYRCSYVSGTPGPTLEASAAAWWTEGQVLEWVAPAHAVRCLMARPGPVLTLAHDGQELLGGSFRPPSPLTVARPTGLRLDSVSTGPTI